MAAHQWTGLFNGLVFSWNAPSWSISAELWFYLFLPLLAATRHLWAWVSAIAIVAFAIIFAVPLVPAKAFEFSTVHMIMQHPVVRMVEFAGGVVAGRIFNAGYRIPGGVLLELAALAVVGLYAWTSPAGQQMLSSFGLPKAGIWYSQSGGFAVFAAAIFIFAQNGGAISRALSWQPLVLLGEISFSTYMLHQLVMRYAAQHQWADSVGWPAAVVGVLILVYGGSYLLWRIVEAPARRKIIAALSNRGHSSMGDPTR